MAWRRNKQPVPRRFRQQQIFLISLRPSPARLHALGKFRRHSVGDSAAAGRANARHFIDVAVNFRERPTDTLQSSPLARIGPRGDAYLRSLTGRASGGGTRDGPRRPLYHRNASIEASLDGPSSSTSRARKSRPDGQHFQGLSLHPTMSASQSFIMCSRLQPGRQCRVIIFVLIHSISPHR